MIWNYFCLQQVEQNTHHKQIILLRLWLVSFEPIFDFQSLSNDQAIQVAQNQFFHSILLTDRTYSLLAERRAKCLWDHLQSKSRFFLR